MTAAINRLLDIMTKLRDPDGGCPWDVRQDFASIAPYTIEEAYEVADAIDRADMDGLRDELGDLLFQVVFHAEMAREAGRFDFDAVADGVSDKMVRRHPHVFGDAVIDSAAAQTRAWEDHKEQERRDKSAAKDGRPDEPQEPGALDGVPQALPALLRAEKLGKRASRVGFDWPEAAPVLAKIREEIGELESEMDSGGGKDRLAHELGDLLFACANMARHLKINPESALRDANGRFERRFRRVETLLADRGKTTRGAALAEMEAAWEQAKAEETG